jgi:hypothetical protein
MRKMYIIVVLVLLSIIIGVNIYSEDDHKTGVLINDYSYGIGSDDESGLTKVDFSIYLHNNTSNSIIIKSVKPVVEERLEDLINGEDKIYCDNILLEPDTGISVEGIIYFEKEDHKRFWVKEDGLVMSFIVDSEILIKRIE